MNIEKIADCKMDRDGMSMDRKGRDGMCGGEKVCGRGRACGVMAMCLCMCLSWLSASAQDGADADLVQSSENITQMADADSGRKIENVTMPSSENITQTTAPDSIQTIENVTVTGRRSATLRMSGAENGVRINREELFKAACCNLGESFTTNPSVDVSTQDATTGAKQIKLLGLSGTYVQMLTENMPNFRGAAAPYALDYVPGAWMSGIEVSKGSASVRNGYESITGQIDVEYLKPEADDGVTVNLYGNTMERFEANADASTMLSKGLSTEVLAHYQKSWDNHDGNGDTFLDMPNVEQWNLQSRWHFQQGRYIFHGGVGMLRENRLGGQNHHTAKGWHEGMSAPLFRIDTETDRYEGYMKHAFIIDPDHGTNVALIACASMHEMDALYGVKQYYVNEKNAYGQLLFETNIDEHHNLAAGLSLNYDYLGQRLTNAAHVPRRERETTPGAYTQYTLNLHGKLIAMAGLRVDHSSLFGTFLTPRFHLKIVPGTLLSLRLSAGKGYRTVHAVAENAYLLASGRRLDIDALGQENAWNYGASAAFYLPLWGNTLKLNAEYYHTRFGNQAVTDYDSEPGVIRIANLSGKSYSNTFQVDATYPLAPGLELTAAWRINDVKTTFGGILMEKPLTSRYKALFTATYKTPLELWQFDATLQLNGGGRMPTPHDALWASRFHAYEQLSMQVTRWFRHFSLYIGGENLTAVRQHQTIINAADPWSDNFDPTMLWGPVHGALGYVGVRINIGRD